MASYIRDNHFVKAVGMRTDVEAMIKPLFPEDDKRPLAEKLVDVEKKNVLEKEEIDLLFSIIKLGNHFAHEQEFDCDDDKLSYLKTSFDNKKSTISNKLSSINLASFSNSNNEEKNVFDTTTSIVKRNKTVKTKNNKPKEKINGKALVKYILRNCFYVLLTLLICVCVLKLIYSNFADINLNDHDATIADRWNQILEDFNANFKVGD